MSFSTEWDEEYKQGRQMAVWPWSHLISLVLRHSSLRQGNKKVLEVGCGAGANFPFFLQYTNNVYGIDGSATIIDYLKQKFPQLEGNLKEGDFCKEFPFDEQFDLIVDRAATTNNTEQGLKQFLALARKHLTDDGVLVIMDWFSTAFSDMQYGTPLEGDVYTRANFTQGTFKGLGKVHFFDEAHIRSLTQEFDIVHLEHSVNTIYTEDSRQTASWHLVLKPRARKI